MTKPIRYEIYGLHCLCHPEDGIRYVGETNQGIRQRLSVHRAHAKRGVDSRVCRWIRKHGPRNVEIQLIEKCTSVESMHEREIYWIAWFRSIKSDMVNVLDGGGRAQLGQSRPDISERMRGKNNPMYGKDRRELMAYAKSFQKPASPETRAKMSASQTGRKHKQETKDAIGRGAKAYSNLPETKAARSKRATGESNAMARFTEDQVREIRQRNANGETYYSIAREYGCNSNTISMMCRRVTWKHVE